MLKKQNYIKLIIDGWWIIALAALSALTVSLLTSYYATPIYRSSARYIISPNPAIFDDQDVLRSLDTLERASVATNYAEIFGSEHIYNQAITSLGFNPEDLNEYDLSVVVLPGTDILQLSIVGPSPEVTSLLVMATGQEAIDFIQDVYQVYSVNLLNEAKIPSEPFSPNPARNAGVATLLGLVLGFGLVMLRSLNLFTYLRTLQESEPTDTISNGINDPVEPLNRERYTV